MLVAGGPMIVVVASIYTGYIAMRGADNVVAEDYYKQGLMINKDIQRDAQARQLNLSATVTLNQASGHLSMLLSGNRVLPDAVQISVASSGKKMNSVTEVVRRLSMKQVRPGQYEGDLSVSEKLTLDGVKLLHIKVETLDWRLTGDWFDPEQRQAHLAAAK